DVAGAVEDVASARVNAVFAVAGLRPFLGDQHSGEVLRGGLLNLVVLVHCEHAEVAGRSGVATQRLPEGNVVEVVDSLAAGLEKRAHEIGPPKRGKDIHEGFVVAGGDVGFGDKHGNAGRESVIAPDLQNMACKVRFPVKLRPLQLTFLKRIVLKGNKREIAQ